MKKSREEKGKPGKLFRWDSFSLRVVLCVVWLGLPGMLPAQQPVSFRLEKVNLKQALQVLKEKTGVNFVYNTKDVDDRTIVSANVDNRPLEEALKLLLDPTPYVYERVKDYFLIRKGDKTVAPDLKTVRGVVKDENGQPMPGVNVRIEGTYVGQSTDEKGAFAVSGLKEGAVLVFSFIGYKEVKVTVGKQDVLEMTLEPMTTEMEEVVVTGMFNRRAESFTGSATTVKGDELRRAGNQNLLASLKNIDPSFVLTDNLEQGSNPNRMPEIYLRGRTSIPSLKGEYEGNPNQPLFILDGFETTMEKVYDLNMNLVASVTLLKDAAAKAIYGAKAANGVVVIETVRPQEGRLRVSYTGSVDITAPDLTSYDLCNASEKLQAEVLAGKYESDDPAEQAKLTAAYNELYNEIARGVDTYWLSQPLRTGIGQKHSLYIDGGNEAMRYSANISYNRINGVMKGSDRRTVSGMVSLSYRYKSLLFRNNLSVDKNKAYNSPYGSFSAFAEMNPYLRIRDEKGALIKDYGNNVYNPLYNATIGTKDYSNYLMVTENFYGEWSALENLKFTARVGITLRNEDSDNFKPASHTDYASVQIWDSNYADRGEYRKNSGKSLNLALDAGVNYTLEKGRHLLFANGTYSLTQSEAENYSTVAVGFPSDKLDFITAGNSYINGKPTGSESTVHTIGFTTAFNYSYANRYLADFSWRASGSSQFGANQRFGYFWSAGLGWNVHNEAFMQNQSVVNLLKIRGSLGYTGSQNFSAYQAIPAYSYITDGNYKGEIGMILAGLANEDLKWQQQYDRNVGFDLTLFDRLSVRADFYSNITKDLLTDISVVPSTGFATYKDNLGETINRGWQIGMNYRLYAKDDTYVNISANVLRNSNEVRKISDYLKAYNAAIDAEKDKPSSMVSGDSEELLRMQRDPSTRYEEGQSLTAIWAVRSMGIDPVTGQEIFLKRDGKTTTTEWSAADQVVCGDTEPKVSGNIGLNAGWKGLSVALAFTFKWGGQMYNSTLVNKIENVDVLNKNVDVRALTERWNTPGVETRYKSIRDYSTTKSTSRFVEDLNELVLSSVNVTYDLNRVIRKMPFENVRLTFNMSDIGRLSTMRQERGTSYPFARTFSFGLTADF